MLCCIIYSLLVTEEFADIYFDIKMEALLINIPGDVLSPGMYIWDMKVRRT